jgi:5-formyltetrahydrofolate cyclo-ligase
MGGLMKERIRKEILNIRKSYDKVEEDSHKIIKNIKKLPHILEKQVFLFYYPHQNEVNLLPLLNELKNEGKTVLLPKVNGGFIVPVLVKDLQNLKKGKFSILEPEGKIFSKEKIDVIFVPAIVFDKQGHRIGFGKGYYDRFLKDTKSIKVGVAYDFQIVDEIPFEEHDVPVDFVITPTKIIKTKKGGNND